MSLSVELQLEGCINSSTGSDHTCCTVLSPACQGPKVAVIVHLKIFSAIGIQELPEVKVGSWMVFIQSALKLSQGICKVG